MERLIFFLVCSREKTRNKSFPTIITRSRRTEQPIIDGQDAGRGPAAIARGDTHGRRHWSLGGRCARRACGHAAIVSRRVGNDNAPKTIEGREFLKKNAQNFLFCFWEIGRSGRSGVSLSLSLSRRSFRFFSPEINWKLCAARAVSTR